MAYQTLRAIMLTGHEGYIEEAHTEALRIFGSSRPDDSSPKEMHDGRTVSAIIDSPANGYRSFFIAPDGSKKGMHRDVARRRDEFCDWLTAKSSVAQPAFLVDWVEVLYGDDSGEVAVTRSSEDLPADEGW